MLEENRDFWETQLQSINMDGFGIMQRLSPIDRKVIYERCEALRGRERYIGIFVSGHIDIKAESQNFLGV